MKARHALVRIAAAQRASVTGTRAAAESPTALTARHNCVSSTVLGVSQQQQQQQATTAAARRPLSTSAIHSNSLAKGKGKAVDGDATSDAGKTSSRAQYLTVDVPQPPTDGSSQTVRDVLLTRVPAAGAARFLVAVDDGTESVHSLHDPVPQQCSALRFLAFEDDERARAALWWTSAFVVSATLHDAFSAAGKGVLTPASPPRLVDGGGFAVQFLVRDGAKADAGSSAISSTLDQCSSLIRAEAGKSASLLRELDLAQIEKKAIQKAASIARDPSSFDTPIVSHTEAQSIFKDNPFKLEELEARSQEQVLQLVSIDNYTDILPLGVTLCASPEIIKALKLQEKSAATWKPVEAVAVALPTKQALIRLRGVSFPTSAGLKAHTAALEQALKYDHRAIGQAQRLFFTHDASPGTPFILPHGMRIAAKIERVIRDLYRQWGYDEVLTPQVFKAELWKQSGHWDNYRDDMFAVEGFKEMQERAQAAAAAGEGHGGCCGDAAHAHAHAVDAGSSGDDSAAQEASYYGLKPMNCPGHCILFAAQEHSYRDLPIRYAEFSPLHRNEASGALTGLTRVRRFHQDDAHVFCRFDQIFGEIASMLTMLREAYTLFGFAEFELVLSTRPPQFLGELSEWDRAEDALRSALDESGLAWTLNEADGAFYGPKIDIRLVDASGRRHQTATIQLDFQLPRRFGLRYVQPSPADVSPSGQTRGSPAPSTPAPPVMIHRAILGSMERFMAILIENTRGMWPFWLNPRQAVVIPVSTQDEALVSYAKQVRDLLALGTPVKPPPHRADGSSAAAVAAEAVADAVVADRERRASHAFHVDVDASNETLGKRVRRAQLDRVSFVCVVGHTEVQNGTVQVRSRDGHSGEDDGSETQKTQPQGRPRLPRDMGPYTPAALRDLFVRLDDHHW